jgi:hypothetical protein
MGTLRQLDRSRPGCESRLGARQDRVPFPRARCAPGAGARANGKPVRFRVKIDGQSAGSESRRGYRRAREGKITDQRLYQLIRQKNAIEDRTFEIEFLDPGAQAYAFTFG